ncbi:MAG: ribosomal-protein-alanine N-acetyltransferase [Acidobacteria bacterium]|nr:MAG: ribosomal-protein-alanine N-acetyltransferase [Acidobacteriota bacterium]PYS85579.1 MAG: ribosomal-protein-alanine N-acetyltransferase [Acidobacteriota bacterium]
MCEHDLLEVVEIEESTGLSQWGWEAYRAELSKPEAVMLAARREPPDPSTGRRLVGFAAARVSAEELHINNIGVRAELRRLGVGRALLGTCLDLGAHCGARLAVLEVRASNAAALGLYERLGFKIVGERRKYYKGPVEDALIMTRPLVPKA